jgi:hypothetical protein
VTKLVFGQILDKTKRGLCARRSVKPIQQSLVCRAALAFSLFLIGSVGCAGQTSLQPRVMVVKNGESVAKPEECRGTVVGPGINQPDPFPGYGGFVGWESPIRLRNGTWLVSFNAGYWHASAPTPLRYTPKTLALYRGYGMPIIDAPTGGRAMITRSSDEGRTWSKPVTLIDTPLDDRHPSIVELPDGTLICSFFTYSGDEDPAKHVDLSVRTLTVRSFDHGLTWEQKPRELPSPFLAHESEFDGPMVLLKDGSVLITAVGPDIASGFGDVGVFRTTDRGESWQLLSVVKADHDLSESAAVQLPDGRLIMASRDLGDLTWSDDGGRTWTKPVHFDMKMVAPSLYVMKDGTLVCLFSNSGVRLIFSRNDGETWIAPSPTNGFLVDHSYGYAKAMVLPDNSLYVVHLSTGGHKTRDAQTNSIWSIRVRIRPDYCGIDLLPAPERK